MLGKIIAFQRLLIGCSALSKQNAKTNKSNFRFGILYGAFIIVYITSSVIAHLDVGFSLFLFGCMVVAGIYIANSVYRGVIKNVPVSDRFVLANVLFVLPVFFALSLMIMFGIFIILAIGEDTPYLLGNINPLSILISVIIMAGMYFLYLTGGLHRNKKIRTVWVIAETAVAYVLLIAGSRFIHYKTGYYGKVSISDITGYFPATYMLPASIVFLTACIIFSWKYSMYLYRKDKNGQRKNTDVEEDMVFMNGTKEYKAGGFRNNKTLTGIGIIVILAAIAIVYLFIGVLFMGAGKEKDSINVEHTSADDYNKWDAIQDDNNIAEETRYFNVSNIIFPDTVNENDVEYYHAGCKGWSTENGGISDISYHRILVQKLPQDKYQEEKRRVSTLTYEYNDEYESEIESKTNHILYDDEHFLGEAYIAVYDVKIESYEYALFDDSMCRVIYVFGENENPTHYAKDYDITPKLFSPVITVDNANDDRVSYSIYTFYNKKYGWYE